MQSDYLFSCSILSDLNGYKLKAAEPDENGFFDCVVGCLGVPTRGNVIYEPQSVIDAMKDTSSRFNICLRDGNLAGEDGHPDATTREDIPRLLKIDEHYISHYFGAIWVDNEPVMVKGMEALPIRAKVKPAGPYADTLERSLRDPFHNTSFSIRSICLPSTGPDPQYDYRKVQILVTFDFVHAPGFEITSKRYNSQAVRGTESFSELNITKKDLSNAIVGDGMESLSMVTDADVRRLYGEKNYSMCGRLVGKDIVGHSSILDPHGECRSAASLMYGRR